MKVVKRQLSVGLLLAKRPLSQKFQDATTAAETCSPKKLRISVLSSSLSSTSEEDDTDATQPPFPEEDDDSLGQKVIRLLREEEEASQTKGLPLEIMTMIASYLVHPGEAHALSLVSRAWNGACQIAFPRHASPRFIMYAIYENPARLSEVESIADNSMALLALCATVRDEAQLRRLARPDTLPKYVGCVRQAVNDRNYQALCALLTYGLTTATDPIFATEEGVGGWALPAMLDAIHVLTRSSDESAPLVFYRAIEGHGQPIAHEIVRATCFRRYATGIKIILNIAGIATVYKKDSVYGTDENVRLLLATAATMNEDLLLSVLNTFPSQAGRILSSPPQQQQHLLGGGPDNFMQTIIRAGWIRAADAIIEAVDDCGHDTHVLLRYSVITGKTWLVRDILFPPRRSSRSKTRERSTAVAVGTGILTGAKRKRSLSQSPAPGAVTLSDDSLFREAVLLGHEDIATILCLFAPQFVTGQLVIHAVRAGHRAEFIKHLIEYLTEEDKQMCAEQCVRTAIASKNYEVIAMLVSDFVSITYNKETLMSILASLGPFKIYAPIVSILLHSPRFRHLF